MVAVAGVEDPNKLDDDEEAGAPNGVDVDDWVVDPKIEEDGVEDAPNGEDDAVVADEKGELEAGVIDDDPNNEVDED